MSRLLVLVKLEQPHFTQVLPLTTQVSRHNTTESQRNTLEGVKMKASLGPQESRSNMRVSYLSSLIVLHTFYPEFYRGHHWNNQKAQTKNKLQENLIFP